MPDDSTRSTATIRRVTDSRATGHTEAGAGAGETRAGSIGAPVQGGYVGGVAWLEQ